MTTETFAIKLFTKRSGQFNHWLLKLNTLKILESQAPLTEIVEEFDRQQILLFHLTEQTKPLLDDFLLLNIPLIVVSDSPSTEEGTMLFKQGIKGYIASDTHPQNLIQVIEVVSQGNVWLGHNIMSAFIEKLNQQNRENDDWKQTLTEREVQTTEAILQGKSNKEIADELCVSERTVKFYVHNILEKFDVKDRLALVLKIQNLRYSK